MKKLTLKERIKNVYKAKGNWVLSFMAFYIGIASSGIVIAPLTRLPINSNLLWGIWGLLAILFTNVLLKFWLLAPNHSLIH